MQRLFRINDWPIFYKLLASFLLLALIAIVPVSIINQQQARQGLLEEAQRNLSNIARKSTSDINEYLFNLQLELEQVASNEGVRNFMSATQTDRSVLGPQNRDQRDSFTLLRSRAPLLGQNTYLVMASLSGQVELTSEIEGGIREGETNNLAETVYFKEVISGRRVNYVSDPQIVRYDPSTGTFEAVFYIAIPVRDNKAEITGVVAGRISMENIWAIVNLDKDTAGSGSYTMLVDPQGIRIGDSRSAENAQARFKYLFTPIYNVPASGPGSTSELEASARFPKGYNFNGLQEPITAIYNRATAKDFNQNDRFFETKLNEADYQGAWGRTSKQWSYFVVVPNSTYAAAANNITFTSVVIGLVALILLVILAFIGANALTRPVRRISSVLGRIGMGDFEARVPVKSKDELGQLAETVNVMFDNTLTLIQTREEKELLQSQITRLLEEISSVAEGDLTVQAEVTADITGAIADSFNLMIEELRRIIANIQSASSQTINYVDLMVANARRLDQVSDRQANRVMGSNTSVSEINTSIQRVSAAANDAAQVAQEARHNASYGGQAVDKTVFSMNRIRNNVQETAKKIKRLGESSQQIGEIVKLIDDIADQTNMLALNAAIQAATAGEQGKGFSVVTEEVRRLAQRSSNAAREIASLVKSIQDDTNAAVVAMEESTGEVVEGSRVADEAGKALRSIEQVVSKLADLIFNISESSLQQAITSSNIARSMNEVSTLTQEATSLRRESSEVVAMVARTAEELRNSVSAFKVTVESRNLEDNRPFDLPRPEYMQYAPPSPNDVPESGAVSWQPTNGEVALSQNEKSDDMSPFIIEDSDFFESMFDEVATSRGNKNAGAETKKPPANQPQALG